MKHNPNRRNITPAASGEQANPNRDDDAPVNGAPRQGQTGADVADPNRSDDDLVNGAIARVSAWLETLPKEEQREVALGLCLLDASHEGVGIIYERFVNRGALPGCDRN